MSTKSTVNLLALGALSIACVLGQGCVADRPSRNGVFNENQYLRKAFVVRPGDATNPDSGWMLKATVTEASEPNVYGDSSVFGLYAGSHSSGDLMHFVVTSDKLQMVSNRELAANPAAGRVGETINAWPVTNVDLKYRVNLDGEKTNFYEENQELDWQTRQWVKVNFDKNDMSDLAPLGAYYNASIANCADLSTASTTLVPGSFIVDEAHDYMEWSVQVTLPIKWTQDCVEAYGSMGDAAARLGREFETVNLKYSMVRAVAQPTYQAMAIQEKDPIQKKYGPIIFNTVARDPATGLLGASSYVVRFDPTKQIDWYFENGFPASYMPYFTSNAAVLGKTPALQGVTTIEDATNQLLMASGAAARVKFHAYNEPLVEKDGSKTPINRQFGDVRWNMLRWLDSPDQQNTGEYAGGFAGVTSVVVDPRTGEALTNDIVFENFPIKDYYTARIDAYLQTIGASQGSPFDPSGDWPAPTDSCSSQGDVGKSIPIIPATAATNHNGLSTLFQKMQTYLYKPTQSYGYLGPQDFVLKHVDPQGNPDADFYNAYYAYLPYIVFGDPALNPFVTPEAGSANTPGGQQQAMWSMIDQEAQLHSLESQLDHGWVPFDVNAASGEQAAVDFMKNYKQLTLNHRALRYSKYETPYMPGIGHPLTHADTPDSFTMEAVIQRDARHCVQDASGIHWESKNDWINNLANTYWSQVFWHEFGHAMGLEHNFMASVDLPNFPTPIGATAGQTPSCTVGTATPTCNADGTVRYPLYSSSVMEYNANADRIFWTAGWGPYDAGAITWIYANVNGNPANVPQMPANPPASIGVSGQQSPNYPWIDPNGFDSSGNEHQFLYCNERHMSYTPLCRAGDMGTTPSEITANEIDAYEWQYKWRNFRQYRKIWDDSKYGDTPMNFVTELRRFLPLWSFDMSSGELTQRFQQIGVNPPMGAVSAQFYYDQLTRKFADEMAHSGQLSAAFHEAIVQQSAGARPYVTVFDNFFGDVTQQGIFLDKLDAIQAFTALWPIDNYDLNQSAGLYISTYSQYGTTYYTDQTAIGSLYSTIAEQGLISMLGGAFDAFYYAKPLAVAQFTFDTHDPNYLGANAAPARAEAMDWAGGYQFTRVDDFLAFFRQIAINNNFKATTVDSNGNPLVIDCTGDLASCNYDPRTPRGYPNDLFFSDNYNRFVGPDGRRWIWVWLQDRNEWLVADQDRNPATYVTIYNFATDVIFGKDDGNITIVSPGAYGLELQLKYIYDYYAQAQAVKP